MDELEPNIEFRIAEWKDDLACIYIYRGELAVDDSDDGEWFVEPGNGLVVELYDRCDSSIWFAVTEEQALEIAELFTESVHTFAEPKA